MDFRLCGFSVFVTLHHQPVDTPLFLYFLNSVPVPKVGLVNLPFSLIIGSVDYGPSLRLNLNSNCTPVDFYLGSRNPLVHLKFVIPQYYP